MKVVLTEQEMIACRTVGGESVQEGQTRAEAVAETILRFAVYRAANAELTLRILRKGFAAKVAGRTIFAREVDAKGEFVVKATEQIVNDVLLAARIDGKRVEFLGWATAKEFHELARKTKTTQKLVLPHPPGDLFTTFETPDVSAIEQMTLSEFSKMDLALLIRSQVYGDLWLISNERARKHVSTKDPTYTAFEAIEVLKLKTETLSILHSFKREFSGFVEVREKAV